MILKTSFFNKGIYKSTVKRYAWGSALYFNILFMTTAMSIFLNIGRDFHRLPDDYFIEYPVILHGQYITAPILLSIVVPTIVALLVFRFIHSKKQAIFTHALPVSRKANYISTLLASFTLMGVPVILNGLILMLISLFGYGMYFTVFDCLLWIGYNLLGLFLMFSCSVFAANITGNSFAMIVLNILIHSFLAIIVVTVSVIASIFLFGYNEGKNPVYESIISNNFANFVFQLTERFYREELSLFKIIEYLSASILLYISSYLLYRKKRIETATDVAGFTCLNSVFRYLVTFLSSILVFALFSDYIEENIIVFILIVAIASLIVYFALEMILKKTVNVLYAWKGYVIFAICFTAFIMLFSHTSFFGYETRVPASENVKEVALYNYYYQDEPPYLSDTESINRIIQIHKEFTQKNNIPKIASSRNYYRQYDSRIHIRYKLQDGSEMYRTYPVSDEILKKIMNELYANEEYKKKCESAFLDEDKIVGASLEHRVDIIEYKELVNVIQEDILALSYDELYPHLDGKQETDYIVYNIRIEYKIEDVSNDYKPKAHISEHYVQVSKNFEKTIKWIKDKGYDKKL